MVRSRRSSANRQSGPRLPCAYIGDFTLGKARICVTRCHGPRFDTQADSVELEPAESQLTQRCFRRHAGSVPVLNRADTYTFNSESAYFHFPGTRSKHRERLLHPTRKNSSVHLERCRNHSFPKAEKIEFLTGLPDEGGLPESLRHNGAAAAGTKHDGFETPVNDLIRIQPSP